MGGHDLSQCVQVLLCAGERAGSPQAKEEMRSTSIVAIISKVNVRTNQEASVEVHLWPPRSSCFLGNDSHLRSSPVVS